jgi:hypothetical protein
MARRGAIISRSARGELPRVYYKNPRQIHSPHVTSISSLAEITNGFHLKGISAKATSEKAAIWAYKNLHLL